MRLASAGASLRSEPLRAFAVRKQAKEIVAALDSVPMDFSGSSTAWRYGGGRDRGRLAEDARADSRS